MVVGIERDHRRVMNPDSDLVLRAGDSLWLVGPTEKLLVLARTAAGQ